MQVLPDRRFRPESAYRLPQSLAHVIFDIADLPHHFADLGINRDAIVEKYRSAWMSDFIPALHKFRKFANLIVAAPNQF